MHRILVTGGAGFVGAHLALSLREANPGAEVIALDNLHRRGAELNVPRLERGGVRFVRGDVRNSQELAAVGPITLRTSATSSLRSASLCSMPAFSVT